jgi:large subunit ribosomal protein L18
MSISKTKFKWFRRKKSVRRNMAGTAAKPRLTVFRSNTHIYAQIIDDDLGSTLASASSLLSDAKGADGGKKGMAKKVGQILAERAKGAGVEQVIFDRNGYKYHGRVAALADGAREGGLSF